MTGEEFEHLVAEKMRVFGWRCAFTPASNDFGADVICEQGHDKMIIQCKCYDDFGSIGNSAVYEAYAAVAHYQAQIGIVVYKGQATRGAKALSISTGVELFHIEALRPCWKYDRTAQKIAIEREIRQASEKAARLEQELRSPKPKHRLDPFNHRRRLERCKGCGDDITLPIMTGKVRAPCPACGVSALY